MAEHDLGRRPEWSEILAKARERRGFEVIKPPEPTYGNCIPGCPYCGGRGWLVDPNMATFTYPLGQVRVCVNRPVNVIAERHGITTDEYESMSWDDIIADGNTGQAVEQVLTVLDRGYGWVYLHGPPGRAKTMILQRAVKEAISTMKTARYAHLAELLNWLRRAYGDDLKDGEYDDRMGALEQVNLLALDEFSRYNQTEWAREQVHLLLDSRYHNAIYQHNVTLIASNSPPQSLDDYLRDRVMDGRCVVVQMQGPSLRPGASWE